MLVSVSHNKTLADIFYDMHLLFKYQGVDERFRTLAFQKASRVIRALPKDVASYSKEQLKALPGIGESITNLILEFLRSGKIKRYEDLKKALPYELLEMMDIKGFGPRSLKRIVTELSIKTKKELVEALQAGRITKLPGFGPKRTEDMQRGLKLHKVVEERMLLWDALALGEEVVAWLKDCPFVIKAEVAGSLRRKKETIGDIDVLVSCQEKNRKKVVAYFISGERVERILVKGDKRASVIIREQHRQVDLRIINEEEWGSGLQYFTGSREHNIHLRSIAREKGFRISEYGIFSLKDEKKLGGVTEEEIYTPLGYQIMPPEMREDKGELILSEKHGIPVLVAQEDIKGDLQMHSNWSDGLNTLEEISAYLRKNFRYDYIAITDHSKNSRIARGMNEKQLLAQMRAIKELNQRTGSDFIKMGVEVDILKDGSLDLSDEILSRLDWVTAAIHDNFDQDNTDRIIRACEHPYVYCIAHPTGRMIGYRDAYKLDITSVIKAAGRTGTALEINAQPARMDLKDDYVMEARKQGVKFVISTDSHALSNFSFMKLGISIARRAWCVPGDILNTSSWNEIETFKLQKRKNRDLQDAANVVKQEEHVLPEK